MYKKCTKCKSSKLNAEFSKDKHTKDGLKFWCKVCRNSSNAIYRDTNPEKIKKKSHLYSKNNKSLIQVKSRLHRNKNAEKYNLVARQWYANNKSDALREKRNKYCKERRHKDLNFKIAHNLRARLNGAVNKKIGSAVKELGCSITELKKHLESLFQPGMSWQNYGEWHIDHKYPLSKCDLTNVEQFKKVCHYSNLQPLWAIDNLIKSNKIGVI